MSADERKRRILEHIKLSADGVQYVSSKDRSIREIPSPPATPKPITTPQSKLSDRQRRVMDHLRSSSEGFGDFSQSDDSRKRKIEDHIRKSLS